LKEVFIPCSDVAAMTKRGPMKVFKTEMQKEYDQKLINSKQNDAILITSKKMEESQILQLNQAIILLYYEYKQKYKKIGIKNRVKTNKSYKKEAEYYLNQTNYNYPAALSMFKQDANQEFTMA